MGWFRFVGVGAEAVKLKERSVIRKSYHFSKILFDALEAPQAEKCRLCRLLDGNSSLGVMIEKRAEAHLST